MTQEDKELLMIDLCARFPYGVKCCASRETPEWFKKLCGATKDSVKVDFKLDIVTFPYVIKNYDVDVKPYLRPISSMTEKEMNKLFDILHINKEGKDEDWIKINDDLGIKFFFPTGKWVENVAEVYDFFYSIHIDIRGLIPMGLALEAPEGMYWNV